MTERRKSPDRFEPDRGYSREDWDAASDTPELTAEDMRSARPFAELFPAYAAGILPRKTRSGSSRFA